MAGSLAGADGVFWIGVLTVVGLLAWLGFGMARNRKPDLYQPRKLFDELCKLHRLDRREIVLLHTLAKERQLEMPALLFVYPEHFTPGLRHNDDGYVEALAAMRTKLFGDEPTIERPAAA